MNSEIENLISHMRLVYFLLQLELLISRVLIHTSIQSFYIKHKISQELSSLKVHLKNCWPQYFCSNEEIFLLTSSLWGWLPCPSGWWESRLVTVDSKVFDCVDSKGDMKVSSASKCTPKQIKSCVHAQIFRVIEDILCRLFPSRFVTKGQAGWQILLFM